LQTAKRVVRASAVKIIALLLISVGLVAIGIMLAPQLSGNSRQQAGAFGAIVLGLIGTVISVSSILHGFVLATFDNDCLTTFTVLRWKKSSWASIKSVRVIRRVLGSSVVLDVERQGGSPENITVPLWLSDERAVGIAQEIERFRAT
jgi:uncharacterized membrane protein YeaQ/YmgE (transglycosylase-associated protein family)